jgi:chromate transporter
VFYTRGVLTKHKLAVSGVVLLVYLGCNANLRLITNPDVSKGVNLVMIALSVWGFAKSLLNEKTKKASAKLLGKEMVCWLFFLLLCSVPAVCLTRESLVFMARGIFSSLISFGGGDAYLTVADGLMVDTGIISDKLFYGSLVPVVNLVPGSILCKTLTGIGYFVGYELNSSHVQGIIVALLGYASSVAASGAVFCIGYYIFQRFKNLNIFHLLSRMIKPIVAGLLVSVMLSLVRQNVTMGQGAAFGIGGAVGVMAVFYVLDLYLCTKKKWSNARVVAVSAVGSFVLCNVLQIL